MKFKYFFFDMDGTVTESRQIIKQDMKDELAKLPHVILISGAERSQMLTQLDGLGLTYVMAQSGNDTSPFWYHELKEKEIAEATAHMKRMTAIGPDMVENRGCQITLSLTGHHAPIPVKKNFDPSRKKRNTLLFKFPFKSKTLACRVAGTTCFDYTRKEGTKGKNIQRLIEALGWKKEDCVYLGDALFKGGNDESVIGVIPTIQVKNPADTISIIKSL